MSIKKSVHPRQLPGIHPGLQQKIKDAEEAELRGESPRQYASAQKVTRPALSPTDLNRTLQARTIGLVDSVYQKTQDFIADLAKQAPFRPGENLDLIWDSLSEDQKVQAGATERFRLEFEATLKHTLPNWKPPHQIGGRLDARALERSQRNIENMIDASEYILAPDSLDLLIRFNRENHALIDQCLKQRAIQGITALPMHIILEDWVKKLIYLEIVSRQRAKGDRGIRHTYGLINHSEMLLKNFKAIPDYSPKERFCLRIIHIHQNLGFTAYAARASYRGGKMYRAYSTRIFTDEINRYRQLLTHDETELIRTAISTHNRIQFPLMNTRILAITRAANFLTPFNPYATHHNLQRIKDAKDYLDDMRDRVQVNNIAGFYEAKTSFLSFLCEEMKMNRPLADDIMAAFNPFEHQHIEETQTIPCGSSKEVSFENASSTFRVNIVSNNFNHSYDFLFSLGQERLLNSAISFDLETCSIPQTLNDKTDALLELIFTSD